MTAPEKVGSVVVVWSVWNRLGARARHWYDQYQIRRDCPHPDHRLYPIFDEGHEDDGDYVIAFYCDECYAYLEAVEVPDEDDGAAHPEERDKKPRDMG